MGKAKSQKLKLLYLAKILMEQTDDTHELTLEEITNQLSDYGILVERKTLYQDFEELRTFGLDIIMQKHNRQAYYHTGSRNFELAELKLLVDAVQSSRFITQKKSNSLIRKLSRLVSVHEGQQLQRQVHTTGRIKTMNESIYYNVDIIQSATLHNHQIRFQYFQWNVRKEMELRRGGQWYYVSPWNLIWDSENYYLIGYDERSETIRHYRVDKMKRLTELNEHRNGRSTFKEAELPDYTRSLFGMFAGREVLVTLNADESMAGVFIDRFGQDIILIPDHHGRFSVTVSVALSQQFIGWVIGLGSSVRITGPEEVVDMMRREVIRLSREYLPSKGEGSQS